MTQKKIVQEAKKATNRFLLAKNKFDPSQYKIEKKYTAGIALIGGEIKDAMKSAMSVKGSYMNVEEGNIAYILNMYIRGTKYRKRMLLLNKKEIMTINSMMHKGFACIPTEVFKINNLIKIDFILARYLKHVDKSKRDKIKKEIDIREARRSLGCKISF